MEGVQVNSHKHRPRQRHSRQPSLIDESKKERENFDEIVVEPVNPCNPPDRNLFEVNQATYKAQLAEGRVRVAEIDSLLAELQQRKEYVMEVLKPATVLLRNVRGNKAQLYSLLEANKLRIEQAITSLNQEKDALRRAKRALTFPSEEAIDAQVVELERKISSSGLSVKEERTLIGKIRNIKAKKNELRAYEAMELAFKNRPDQLATLKVEKEKLLANLNELKNHEKSLNSQVESSKSEVENINEKIQCLKDEKNLLYSTRKQLKNQLENEKLEFTAARDQYASYQKWIKYKKYINNKKLKEANEAYLKQKQEERAAELAKLDPYQEQKDLCSTLFSYLHRFVNPGSVEDDRAEGELERIGEDDEWGYGEYAAISRSKKKKKSNKRTVSLSHSPDVFVDFQKLGLTAPVRLDQVPQALKNLGSLREYYDRAPRHEMQKILEKQELRLATEMSQRREVTEHTQRLFEAERNRILDIVEEAELDENYRLQAERKVNVLRAVEYEEFERTRRLMEHNMCVLQSELLRKVSRRKAEEEMKMEQIEQIQRHKYATVLEQFLRNARKREALSLIELEQEVATKQYFECLRENCNLVTAILEKEQTNRITEMRLHDILEAKLRKLNVLKAIHFAEKERARRINEAKEDSCGTDSSLVAGIMEKEQRNRITEMRLHDLLGEKLRKINVLKAIESAEKERLRRINEANEESGSRRDHFLVEGIIEKEQRNRITEMRLHDLLGEKLRKINVLKAIESAERERLRRIGEAREENRLDKIALVIRLAEEERMRRISTILVALEDGEPVLVTFLRCNPPTHSSCL